MDDKNKKRDGSADLLKGMAVLLMIQVHLMEQFATPDLYASLLGRISLFLGGPACAPVFMAVMGYYLAFTKKSFLQLLIRGFALFAGGIVLNLSRSAHLLARIFTGQADLDPWQFIFGADILSLAGLSVIFIALLRVIFKRHYLAYFTSALLIVTAAPWLAIQPEVPGVKGFVTSYLWGYATWSYFPLFPWVAYVLTGYAFNDILRRITWLRTTDPGRLLAFTIPAWLILLPSLSWATGITSDLEGPGGYYHHGILFFTWTLLFMIAYLAFINYMDAEYGSTKFTDVIKWMGQRVTALYVIQWLLIGNIAASLYRSQHFFQVIAWFTAITLLTLAGGYIFQRLRQAIQQ
jgi:uncharacterized membrane protein